MRIGLFGDVHANLIALDAVLADMRQFAPDEIVCLGDLAITGPHPHEVVRRVQDLGCVVVRGNWDDWAIQIRADHRPDEKPRAIDLWCAERLSAEDLAFLTRFPLTYELPLPAHASLLCYHGSPRNYNDILTSTTPPDQLDELLDGRHDGVMAGGHTHVAMLRHHANALVINPGSVSENWHLAAWPTQLFNAHAEYAVVTVEGDTIAVTFRRVPVNHQAVIEAARLRNMPDLDWWSRRWPT
jgi:predicted phosphodiesterase